MGEGPEVTTPSSGTRRSLLPALPEPVRETISRIAAPSRVPVVVGRLTYLVAILDILAVLLHGRRFGGPVEQAHRLVPSLVDSTASAAQVVTGLLLLPVAHGLVRRKRMAWALAVVGLGLSASVHLLHARPVAVMLVVALLAVLVAQRRQFTAVGDPSTRWWAPVALVLLLAVSVLLGLLLLTADRHALVGTPGLAARVGYVLSGLVGLGSGLGFRTEAAQDRVDLVLGALGLLTAAIPAWLALRPAHPRPALSPEDDTRLRALLDRHPDSLGYFNLRRDKSVVWSESGKSAIAYRVVSGVMLASGDPVGDPEAWPGAIKVFLDEAERHAWTPAVLGCSERAGLVWTRGTDFEALELGDEAVVQTDEFSLQGRPMRNVRQMVNRITRAGYTTEVRRVRDLTDEECATILADARAWRGTETERGFSMASDRLVDRAADPDAVLVTATEDGRVRGFLQLVPWGDDGVSLDVMLRDREAEAGVTDLMVVALLQAAPGIGIRRVSLNFATFRAVLERGERLGAGPVTRASRAVLVFLSRWFQIESLYRFNLKFAPRWQPRFLVYPRTADLPRIGLAALEAEAFVTWPRLGFLKRFTG